MPVQSGKDITVKTGNLRIMLVGGHGTGKSHFASTCPGPIRLFDFDGHALVYKGADFDYSQYPTSFKGWNLFEKDFGELKRTFIDKKYKTVVWDSTTTMTDLAMEYAMMLDPARSSTKGPVWNVHYQMVRNLVEGKIRQLLELDANIILISHIDKIKDTEGAVIGLEPLLTGQLSEKIPCLFGEVYYTSTRQVKGETQYQMQTVCQGMLKARSIIRGRYKLLPDFIPNDYGKLIEQATKQGGK